MTEFNPFYFMVGMSALGLAPFMLMMTTSYVKIVVVVSLVRNALGVQQIPPVMVINGLAIVLTIFIMAPVAEDTLEVLSKQEISQDLNMTEILRIAPPVSEPMRNFLERNTDAHILQALLSTARNIWPQNQQSSINERNLFILVPSFTISELTRAFEMGFLLFLPFVAIDLIISNILLAMGMMMVSPMTISLPFKLLLFVTLNGWLKITQGLLLSYN